MLGIKGEEFSRERFEQRRLSQHIIKDRKNNEYLKHIL